MRLRETINMHLYVSSLGYVDLGRFLFVCEMAHAPDHILRVVNDEMFRRAMVETQSGDVWAS